ncbi:hypothetical protein HJC99_04475 [Candidatus Saccharibacteria bacterium]|nr:hypothetical protein [Candidatus Saccharibacteria bacterium]
MPDMTVVRRVGFLVAAGALSLWPAALWADATQLSPSYSINESQIGGIGDNGSQSTSYSFKPSVSDGGSTLGDSFTGNSASTIYQINSGFNTASSPTLSFSVTSSSVNLGTLSTSVVRTGTATFNVKNYTSSGYVVQVIGAGLTSGSHTLSALSTDTASSPGTEQFGLNTVFNTVAGVGANPVQNPAGFGYGVAGDGATGTFGTTRPYTIPDKYRFVSGDTIASAPSSSGETDYTTTFMANISNLTPGGTYQGNIIFVATGTF